MKPLRVFLLAAASWFGLASLAAAADGDEGEAKSLFETKIFPVLSCTCFKCHGKEKARGRLGLDTRAALLKGGDHGPAVVPGDPDKSLLIQAVRQTHEDIKMPPDKPFPAPVVDSFVAWVKDGATWSAHLPSEKTPATTAGYWAFEPLKRFEPPVDKSGWCANPIDRFVADKLRRHGLKPAEPAGKRALIRRVTFDLLGLPPAPAEVSAFVNDHSQNALERVVDRLLASPHYGEHWGRHWLDVVRYADTAGFEVDPRYPNAWRYRDYIVHALNADKPIDRFMEEQVAGDELWPRDGTAALATGVFCVGPALPESAMISNQLENEWLSDAVDTTGAAFLGLTLGCARCHDHKYDPIAQRDYYAFQAIFAASDRPFPDKVRQVRIKALNGLLSDAPVPRELLNDPRCTLLTEDRVGLHLFPRAEPLTVHRLHRGELSKPREVMEPAFPAALLSTDQPADFSGVPPGQRRARLARWLTSAANPLPLRVLVNRVWGWHFGQAIVRTPNDFGTQGEPPTHPELLDWLVRDFTDHGWSLKRLHRLILLSSTYQMCSVAEGPGLEADPENRLLWHFPRRRLEGEVIRDNLLACAGNLNLEQGGPPVMPPLSAEELTGLFDAKDKWPVTKDRAQYSRRSVYLLVRRTFSYPLLAAFDPPEVMTSCAQRAQTIVATQALTLLNSPVARAQAAAMARRLGHDYESRPNELVQAAWQLAFARPPNPAETEQALRFLRQRAAVASEEAALTELCLALFNANEFIYLD